MIHVKQLKHVRLAISQFRIHSNITEISRIKRMDPVIVSSTIARTSNSSLKIHKRAAVIRSIFVHREYLKTRRKRYGRRRAFNVYRVYAN